MSNSFISTAHGIILKTEFGEYLGKCGPFHSKEDVLDYCDDHTLCILHDQGDRTEDLSEDLAGYWLDLHPDISEDDFVPPFVRRSMNYEIAMDEREEPLGWVGFNLEAGRQM